MWSVGMDSLERGAWGKLKPQDLAGLGSSPRGPKEASSQVTALRPSTHLEQEASGCAMGTGS